MFLRKRANKKVTTTLKAHIHDKLEPKVRAGQVKWNEILENGALNWIRNQKTYAELEREKSRIWKNASNSTQASRIVEQKLLTLINKNREKVGDLPLSDNFIDVEYDKALESIKK